MSPVDARDDEFFIGTSGQRPGLGEEKQRLAEFRAQSSHFWDSSCRRRGFVGMFQGQGTRACV